MRFLGLPWMAGRMDNFGPFQKFFRCCTYNFNRIIAGHCETFGHFREMAETVVFTVFYRVSDVFKKIRSRSRESFSSNDGP